MIWSEQQNMAGLSLAVAACEQPNSLWLASLTSCISSSSVALKHSLLQVLPASDATEKEDCGLSNPKGRSWRNGLAII